MRKAIFVIYVAVLLVAAGPSVNAWVLERVYNYYTDSSFTTACGYVFFLMIPRPPRSTLSPYPTLVRSSCESGEQMSAHCQEWNGTQWVDVACPDEPVTDQKRVQMANGVGIGGSRIIKKKNSVSW